MSFWGAAALICVAAAVVSATVSAALPDAMFAGLHRNRFADDSATASTSNPGAITSSPIAAELKAAQAQLAGLVGSQARLRAANAELEARLAAALVDSHRLTQRVGALETSLPKLADAISARPAWIDPAIVTGSIGVPAPGFSRPASDRTDPARAAEAAARAAQPLPDRPAPPTNWAAAYMTSPAARQLAMLSPAAAEPVPLASARRPDPIAEAAIVPDSAAPSMGSMAAASAAAETAAPARGSVRAIGVAVGAPVAASAALSAWQALAAKIGVLLVGTSPLLADDPAGGDGKVLVAGPLPDIAAAGKLCADVDRAGITCTPMPYVGSPLQPAGR